MRIVAAILLTTSLVIGVVAENAQAKTPRTYSQTLCQQALYYCYQVKEGDTWKKLFPGWNERNITKRVNRMNIPLEKGMILAIPKDMKGKVAEDFSPFPKFVPGITERVVIFSLGELYFAAYDAEGRRVITGPIAAGAGCPGKGCATPTGRFRFYQKYGPNAVSSLYPIKYGWVRDEKTRKRKRVIVDRGGAKTPWFMAIVANVGSHGFKEVPGYNASKGCIRKFLDDAQWLNQRFVEVTTVKTAKVNGKTKIEVVKLGTLAIIMNGLPK